VGRIGSGAPAGLVHRFFDGGSATWGQGPRLYSSAASRQELIRAGLPDWQIAVVRGARAIRPLRDAQPRGRLGKTGLWFANPATRWLQEKVAGTDSRIRK